LLICYKVVTLKRGCYVVTTTPSSNDPRFFHPSLQIIRFYTLIILSSLKNLLESVRVPFADTPPFLVGRMHFLKLKIILINPFFYFEMEGNEKFKIELKSI